MPPGRFVVFIVVSLAAFILVLSWSLRHRTVPPPRWQMGWVSGVVVVVGMGFAKFGANAGLSPAIYYGIPALTTIALPPAVFRMHRVEFVQYVVLAFVSSPVIHALFSLLLGWHEYLPFWHIPSITELLGAGA